MFAPQESLQGGVLCSVASPSCSPYLVATPGPQARLRGIDMATVSVLAIWLFVLRSMILSFIPCSVLWGS